MLIDHIGSAYREICWWDWPDEVLKKNIELFSRQLEEEDMKRLYVIYEELHG